jgi:hypothetical protein
MSKISDFIDTLDLPVDATYRCNCPICGGKNTFTITNDKGNVLYNCYKNSCRIAGAHHRNMDAFTIKAILSQGGDINGSESYTEALRDTFVLPPYLTTIQPAVDDANVFVTKWNIEPCHVLYDVRQDRVVFPAYHNHVLYDAVGRSVTNRQPKWLRYGSSPIPYMHGDGDCMVIVEDAISAYKIGAMYPNTVGVALLGTQLTPFHKWFFHEFYRYNKFIVALDKDARDKTIKIVKELRANIRDVNGLNLNDDLKYAKTDDLDKLQEMLNGK